MSFQPSASSSARLTGSLALAQERAAVKRHYGPEYTRRIFHGTPDGELNYG